MRIAINPQPDHLHAVASELFDHAQLAAALTEIFDACSMHGLRKIMIDARGLEGEISLMARYDLGRIAAELQREPVRLVIIGSETQVWPDRFAENVANNRGIMTKVTTDMAEALEWLHRNPFGKSAQGAIS